MMMKHTNLWQSTSAEDVHDVRTSSKWLIALGAIQFLAGVAALYSAAFTTYLTVQLFGLLFVVLAFVHAVDSFLTKGWRSLTGGLALAALSGIVGIIALSRPELVAATLTMLLAMFFLSAGLIRSVSAPAERYPGWGWGMFSGVVTTFLGVLILAGWPASSLVVLGIYVGIEFITAGASVAAIGFMLHRWASHIEEGVEEEESTEAERREVPMHH